MFKHVQTSNLSKLSTWEYQLQTMALVVPAAILQTLSAFFRQPGFIDEDHRTSLGLLVGPAVGGGMLYFQVRGCKVPASSCYPRAMIRK